MPMWAWKFEEMGVHREHLLPSLSKLTNDFTFGSALVGFKPRLYEAV